MNIRKYKISDLQKVLQVHKITMQHVGVYKGEGPWDDDLKDIERNYDRGIFLVGEEKNEIVGIGAIRRVSDSKCELKRMRIVPEFQNRGLGKELLSALVGYARKLKYKEIILETSENQVAAIGLYKKFKFLEYKRELIDGFNCIWFKHIIE